MKSVALLAGIAMALSTAMGFINFVLNLARMGMRPGIPWALGQLLWLFAQASLIAFFFTFYSRAKE